MSSAPLVPDIRKAMIAAVQSLRSGNALEALDTLKAVPSSSNAPRHFHMLLGLCQCIQRTDQNGMPALQEELRLYADNSLCQELINAIVGGVSNNTFPRLISQIFEAIESSSTCMQTIAVSSAPIPTHNAAASVQLEHIFPAVRFGRNVQILGLRNVNIGSGSCIEDGVWLNVCERDSNVRMRIGEKVLISRYSMISTGGFLEIGAYSVISPRVYLSDADHSYTDLSLPLLMQPPTLGRRIIVEENCWIGANAVVSGELCLGRGCIVAASAVVTKDVPPFSLVAGNPARVLKMYNPVTNTWGMAPTPDELQSNPPPSREEYRTMLANNTIAINSGPDIHACGEID